MVSLIMRTNKRIIVALLTVAILSVSAFTSIQSCEAASSLPAPKSFVVTINPLNNRITLKYKKVPKAKKYQIYMSTAVKIKGAGYWYDNYKKIKTTKKTTFVFTKAKYNCKYQFKVRAIRGKIKGKFCKRKEVRSYTKARVQKAREHKKTLEGIDLEIKEANSSLNDVKQKKITLEAALTNAKSSLVNYAKQRKSYYESELSKATKDNDNEKVASLRQILFQISEMVNDKEEHFDYFTFYDYIDPYYSFFLSTEMLFVNAKKEFKPYIDKAKTAKTSIETQKPELESQYAGYKNRIESLEEKRQELQEQWAEDDY